MPKIPNDLIDFIKVYPLSSDQVLIVNRPKKDSERYFFSTNISIISLNFQDETYDFADTQTLSNIASLREICYDSKTDIALVKYRQTDGIYKLQIFQIDDLFSKLSFQKSLDFFDQYCHFNIVDGRIVFAKIQIFPKRHVESMMFVDENDSLKEIEGSGASFESKFLCEEEGFGRVS